MKGRRNYSVPTLTFAFFLLFFAARTWAQIDVGDYTVSGSAEVDGLPRGFNGDKSKFEEYRNVPESVVVPQLQLMIGGKKQDFYLNFDALNVGRDDQNYRLRFGRYGLLNLELEWDQIPHVFDVDNARTPYVMNGGTYTLRNRPTADDATTFSNWINNPANTRGVDLELLNKIGKISISYTPTPGWSFTGKYWSQNTDGRRAFGIVNGSSSTAGNISELAEPIDYQTHNIELGGEYAGHGWSLGLKYNGSLFHNSTSTLVWDNPARPVGNGPCVDQTTTSNWTTNVGTGPCRGQLDLYPSNQAHTFTLTGTASLPLKTQFLGTASYGWRLQDDSFLPTTNNRCYTNNPLDPGLLVADPSRCQTTSGTGQLLQLLPMLSRGSLGGDVRPTMVNLSFVNHFVDHLNLKAYYRFYDLENRSSNVRDPNGIILNDQGSPDLSRWGVPLNYEYSKNTAGFQAGYDFTRWLTGKFNFSWEGIHRSQTVWERAAPTGTSVAEFFNSSEFKIGPTFDIKPLSWLLFRALYQHSWRDAPEYHEDAKMFFVAQRQQDKVGLFTDVSPWETLSFHAGFDFTNNVYPNTHFLVQESRNYSPSIGALYAPLEWLKLFADYNFDWSRWSQHYSSSQDFRGKDKVNTLSLGSDIDLIKNVLGFRIQYGFSQGSSEISNRNTNTPGVENPNWPNNSNTWQELLARLEYQLHKNVAVQVGYYFNNYRSKDYGVDIMNVWMGNVDTATGQLRSIYLGDQFKGSYTAHVALLGLKVKF
jgi:hypothetical protein